MRYNHTAAIIGAGPAGAAAARTLARAGVDAVLVHAPARDDFRAGESLSPAVKGLLAELGVWNAFIADGHMPCHGNYSAWGSAMIAETDFIRSPYGHGWHLDRARFDAMLVRAALESGVAIRSETRLQRFDRRDDAWRLELLADGPVEEISCAWLLDCTGRSRRVASGLGVERHVADRQIAFHARYRETGGATDRESRTLVESMPWGWLHTALLPGGERIVTLFTDAGAACTKPAQSRDGFAGLVDESVHVAAKLAAHDYRIATDPHAIDARTSRLACASGEGWIATGDAAAAYDPLSSYGILFALHSGIEAARALTARLAGDAAVLERYDSLVASRYERFLDERAVFHGYERRWPDAEFWKSRQGRGARVDAMRLG